MITYILWIVLKCRNNSRFQNIPSKFEQDFVCIISLVHYSITRAKGCMYSSIKDFANLKYFSVHCHVPSPPLIKYAHWIMPSIHWIKFNIDDAFRGSPGVYAYACIFRSHLEIFNGDFSVNIGISNSLHAEIRDIICCIENANSRGWIYLYLECDSLSAVQAFSNINLVLWKLQNKWKSCLHIILNANCFNFFLRKCL